MFKKLFITAVCLVPAAAYAFEGTVSFDNKGSLSAIVEQAAAGEAEDLPVPESGRTGVKEWTVMVFVNAKNNLESYGLKDVNEMEMIGSSDQVNVVAELGRISGYYSGEGDWKGSRRYLVQKDDNASAVTSPVLMEIPRSDMGSWEYLADFVAWSKARFPAKHYALIIWNHGSGWNKDFAFEASKGISYDDETNTHITTPQLAQLLQRTGKMDILSMDACLMQMIEVAYEVKDGADYVVASEETEPGDGYTYNTMLEPLVKNPLMGAANFSKVMVDAFTNHYQSIGQGATQSSIKTAALDGFRGRLDGLVDALVASNDLAVAKAAKTKTQSFYYSSNKDVYHFAKLVAESTSVPEVSAAAKELMSFMDAEVVTHNRAYGSRYANAFGLAAYMPSYYSSAYDGLAWARDSKWDDFIKWAK